MSTELLEKYMAGNASQREKENVQRWLEADEENRKEFEALRRLYDITLACQPAGESHARPVRPFAEWLRIAAAVLITCTCSYYFLKPTPTEEAAAMQTLYVPAGQRVELTLADGTKVWLNSQTTFTFPDRFSTASREVFLEGEAWFEVARDDAKLFCVHTKSYDIRVLGTEFNVFAYDNEYGKFETSLLKGSLDVVSPDNTQTVKLLPGTRAYASGKHLTTDTISDYNHFLWKKGIISFENERIEDILNKLQVYYEIEIRNENAAVKNMRYTGKFRTKDGIEHVLNVLKIPTGLRYHRDSEANLIRIK